MCFDRGWRPLGLASRKILDQGAFHLALRSQREDWTVLLLLELALILQFALGLGAQLAYLGVHSLGVSEVFILSELFLREGTSLRPGLKPGEK